MDTSKQTLYAIYYRLSPRHAYNLWARFTDNRRIAIDYSALLRDVSRDEFPQRETSILTFRVSDIAEAIAALPQTCRTLPVDTFGQYLKQVEQTQA